MKKSIFDIFVDGARKGLNIGLNSVLPNVLMAYAIIQVLKVTGILDLLSNRDRRGPGARPLGSTI